MKNSTAKGISPTVRTVVTVILLVLTFFQPIIGLVGVIVMWIWALWPKWLKILITVPFAIFLAFIAGILSFLFLMRPFQISGSAMAPNYNNGMYLLTKILRPNSIIIERGDVVIFKAPNNPDLEYIKRVVGLPGETVTLKSGEVFINGQKLDESKYLSPGVLTNPGIFLPVGKTLSIPAGQYFTLGDNRPNSSDSREWGFVPQENILSKVAFCYWNCSKKQ